MLGIFIIGGDDGSEGGTRRHVRVDEVGASRAHGIGIVFLRLHAHAH